MFDVLGLGALRFHPLLADTEGLVQVVSRYVPGCCVGELLLLLKSLHLLVAELRIQEHGLHLFLKLSALRLFLVIAVGILALRAAKRIQAETADIADESSQPFFLLAEDESYKIRSSCTDILAHLNHVQLVDIPLVVDPK